MNTYTFKFFKNDVSMQLFNYLDVLSMLTSWLNGEHLHYLTMSQIYECSWTFLLPWGLENDPANMNQVGEKELLLIRFQDEEESTFLTQDSEDTVNKRNWQI